MGLGHDHSHHGHGHAHHHVHVWSLTTERPMVTLHAKLREGADSQQTLRAIQERLRENFGIGHATIQIEESGCSDQEENPAQVQATR